MKLHEIILEQLRPHDETLAALVDGIQQDGRQTFTEAELLLIQQTILVCRGLLNPEFDELPESELN